MYRFYFFVIIACCLFFVSLDSSAGLWKGYKEKEQESKQIGKKVTQETLKKEAEVLIKKSPEERWADKILKQGKQFYDDENLTVYIYEEKIFFPPKRVGKMHYKYPALYTANHILFVNKLTESLSISGDLINRANKNNLMWGMESAILSIKSMASSPNSSGITQEQANILNEAQAKIRAEIMLDLVPDIPIKFELQGESQKVITVPFVTQVGGKLLGWALLAKNSEKEIYIIKNIDETFAKRIIHEPDIYKYAYIDGQITDLKAGIYPINLENKQTLQNLDLNLLKDFSIDSGTEMKKYSSKNFHLLILQNVAQKPDLKDINIELLNKLNQEIQSITADDIKRGLIKIQYYTKNNKGYFHGQHHVSEKHNKQVLLLDVE